MTPENQKTSGCRLKVYYDGGCVVCSKEIDLYRKKDVHGRINFIDISSSFFDPASEGLDPDKVKAVFHVKDANNNLHVGVDGFVEIWDVLEIFGPLSQLAKSSIARPMFDLGYYLFAKARPFLPRKQCDDGRCHI